MKGKIIYCFNFEVFTVTVDNGSEFMGTLALKLHFQELKVILWMPL